MDDLTDRERQVLVLMCEGRLNRQIGSALFIADSTVKVHLRAIYRKMGVAGRSDAVAAVARGWPETD
jgi:ATP/maltotriose-dependent transcriptional regulator MalT